MSELKIGPGRPRALQFRLGKRRPCIALVATLGDRAKAEPLERVPNPESLARWCVEGGFLPALPKVSPQELVSARLLREAIYRSACAVRQFQKPQTEDIATINSWASRATLVSQLSADGRSADWKSERTLSPVLATVARDAIDLLTRTPPVRIKLCADPTCRGLFVDESRPGKRRWCAMNVCGNRAKSRTFAHRHRPGAVTVPQAGMRVAKANTDPIQ
jgi:predicted RNA-binding Zn ribbon-like protein